MQRSETSGWSRGSARIAAEEGERADRWGRPGSEGRRRARGAERAGLGCGRWLVGSGAQWGRATRSRASGLSGVLLGRVGNLGRAREGEGAWAVRGKGKEEGWAGRAGALGQGEGGWIGLQGFGCWVGSSLFSFFFLPLFYL